MYLTLEGLKAACRGAADRDSGVRDFEVGVFNGEYVTGVPAGYFEHLSSLRQAGKKRKAAAAGLTAAVADPLESSSLLPDDHPVVVANGGPVNDAPRYREDIRFVRSLPAPSIRPRRTG